MNFSRFKEIILKNREYESDVKEIVKNFQSRVFIDGDIPKVIKEIGKRLDTLVVEIPMKDSDFGACYLGTNYNKYLLLNSNQPRSKMYFAFCHDIYHIMNGTPDYINEKREVHFNQEYFENEIESKANLFAANLLMPEIEFTKMFKLFKEDTDRIEYVIVKLMNYFNAPFLAVLIRLYELQILKDTSNVKKILEINNRKIEQLFEELWLDKEILKPSLKDEMEYLLKAVKNEGHRLVEEKLLTQVNLESIVNNIQELYFKIRVERNE